jgi:hypothetical protein
MHRRKEQYCTYKFLIKNTLKRRNFTWEDNIRMDLREIGYGDVNWIEQIQDKV